MNINLMTWNIDWFRNGCRSGKDMEYFEEVAIMKYITMLLR